MIKEPYSFQPFDYKNQTMLSSEKELENPSLGDDVDSDKLNEDLGEIVDYILQNYIDEHGNYGSLPDFTNFKKHPLIRTKMEEVSKNIAIEYQLGFDLEDYFEFANLIEVTIDKYNESENIFKKVKNVKFFNDLALLKLSDDTNSISPGRAIDKSSEIMNDHKEGYFIRTYAKMRYLSNLDWYCGTFFDRQQELDKQHEDWVDIREMHDDKFNNYQFEFDEYSLGPIVEARGDPFLKEEFDLAKLKHIYRRDVRGSDLFDGDVPDFVYDGDYIVCDLAPGIVGAYSIDGELLGWSNYEKSLFDKDNDAENIKIDIKNQDDVLGQVGDGRTESLVLFKMMASLEFRTQIKKDLGIDLGEFNLSTQFQLLNFIKEADKNKVSQVGQFLNQGKDDERANRVKSFLSLEQDSGMGETILSIGEQLKDEPEVADRLFGQHAEMVDSAESIAETMIKASPNEKNIYKNKIINQVLFEAKELLSNADEILKSENSKEDFITDLEKVNIKVLLLNQVIKQLPREEVAGLNLRDIEEIDRREDLLASELLKDKETLEKIKKIIKAQFPEGDDIVFEEECKNNNNLRLTIAMANNEVISFFSKERVAENIDYIDWFISNPEASIRGLGEATLRLGFSENDELANYAVAKPHVKSFNIFVEKLGFVSFAGSTTDEEYKDHYARVRKLPDDKNLETKKISEASLDSLISSIKTICLKENKIESYLYKSKKLNVCKVEFHGQTHEDDILETDKDGWIMAEIKRQYEKGNVLTRYIPDNNLKDNQVFYAIFEEDNASEADTMEISQVIGHKFSEDKDQLDSKKALSN